MAVCSAAMGWSGRADLQRGPRLARVGLGDVGVAVEAVLAGVVAGLDLDQADVEPRVAVAGEASACRRRGSSG